MNEMRKIQKCSHTSAKKDKEIIDQSDQRAAGSSTHSLILCSVHPGQPINCCSSIAAQNHEQGQLSLVAEYL